MGAEKCPSKCCRQDAHDVLGAPAITNAGKGLRRCIHESIPWLQWGNHRLGAHTKSLGIAKLIAVLIRLSGDPTHRNKTFSRYGTTRERKEATSVLDTKSSAILFAAVLSIAFENAKYKNLARG
mmetsp:Transcript_10467/g.30625  ORF Transcript_10467/g.30625 Transcript_10467/m.30625 type:complete len:124 (-) Transcript_10467:168-539(-)